MALEKHLSEELISDNLKKKPLTIDLVIKAQIELSEYLLKYLEKK